MCVVCFFFLPSRIVGVSGSILHGIHKIFVFFNMNWRHNDRACFLFQSLTQRATLSLSVYCLRVHGWFNIFLVYVFFLLNFNFFVRVINSMWVCDFLIFYFVRFQIIWVLFVWPLVYGQLYNCFSNDFQLMTNIWVINEF